MTQIDRLEALADIAQDSALSRMEWGEVADALPDLIRVARAAKEMQEKVIFPATTNPAEAYSLANTYEPMAKARDELVAALAPLFAEVES